MKILADRHKKTVAQVTWLHMLRFMGPWGRWVFVKHPVVPGVVCEAYPDLKCKDEMVLACFGYNYYSSWWLQNKWKAPICQSGCQEIICLARSLIHWYCSAKKQKRRILIMFLLLLLILIIIINNIVITGDKLFYLFWDIYVYVWNLLVAYCALSRWLWTGAFARAQCPFLARER